MSYRNFQNDKIHITIYGNQKHHHFEMYAFSIVNISSVGGFEVHGVWVWDASPPAWSKGRAPVEVWGQSSRVQKLTIEQTKECQLQLSG